MSGLYVHIPFCATKCRYCDFYSTPCKSAHTGVDEYLDALAAEWRMVCECIPENAREFSTVYVGGGTPSVLTVEQWRHFAHWLAGAVALKSGCEWTIECNPESYAAGKAEAWLRAGANRLSLGVQSFDDRTLGFLGRAHDGRTARRVIDEAAHAGFGSVSVDLMYGLPAQTVEGVLRDAHEMANHAGVAHVSAYELTLSAHSRFGRHRRLLPLPPEQTVREMYEAVSGALDAAGFEHYEVSNYARPGKRSRHNSGYWNHSPYIGLGASAHSFVRPRRWSNVADTAAYVQMAMNGQMPIGHEENLSGRQLGDEVIMLGLRCSDGVSAIRYRELSGEVLEMHGRQRTLDEFVQGGLLVRRGADYVPTSRGMMVADAMAARL